MVSLEQAADKLAFIVRKYFTRESLIDVARAAREPLVVFACVYFAAAALAQPFYVPSGSMQPTLGIGDLLIATKFSYGYNRYSLPFSSGPTPKSGLFASLPEPGDVVVFRNPKNTAVALVKRVVGLPGDRLQMRGGRLWINGRALPLKPAGIGKVEDGPGENAPGTYFEAARYIETLPNGRSHLIYKKSSDAIPVFGAVDPNNTDVYTVPPGHIFVMGDNRDDSADSRFPVSEGGVGYLPAGNVMARARVVLTSVDFVNARGVWEWPFRLRLSRTLNRVR